MANTEKYTTVIQLNSEQAQKEISKLENKIENLKKKREEALKTGNLKSWNKLGKEIEKDNKQLDLMRGSLKKINDTIANMSAAGPKELRDTIKAINQLLNDGSVQRGSQTWNELTAALREAKTELRAIQLETAAQQSIWGKFTKFLNDSWGAVTMIIGSITGLSMTIRKAVSAYSDMEQEMANVRKYTGQTAEEVERMNEDFKQMDTRTAREELNQLAGAAGRLGITETKMVEEFVDGADKIRVALGDDLGEGAVDSIGKLAIAFGEDKSKGLRGAMLATGSALNELVQSSPAQAQPIIEFTSKLSGVGQQAHMSQAQIMGFAAALDQNNQEMATSSTVMSQLITKMYQDPARFAKMAGMEVKNFAQLVKTDMNQALIEWLQHVNSLGDMSVLAGKFDELKMDGTRAVGVLATLAGHIDQVTEAQRTATKAYEEGTSVIDEFNIQNTTVQAETEKAKKRFHDLTIELGERLLPIVRYTISGSSLLVKGLSAVTSFMYENKGAIIATTAAVAGYTVVLKASTIATKTHELATKSASVATTLFNTVTKANPIGLLVAALAAATALFVKYRDRIRGASEATSLLRQTGAKLLGVLAQVAGWLTGLIRLAATLYDKFSFIRKIIQLLTSTFTAGFTTITNAVTFLIDELSGVANIIEGIFTLDWNKVKDGFKQGMKAVADVALRQWNTVKNHVKDTFSAPPAPNGKKVVEEGEKKGKKVVKKRSSTTVNDPEVVSPDPIYYVDEKELEKEEEKRKKILKERADAVKAEYQAEVAEEMRCYRQGLTNYTDYMKMRHELANWYYSQMKTVYGEDSTEYKKLLDDREREENEYYQWTAKLNEDRLSRDRLARERSLRRQFEDEKSDIYHNEDALHDDLFRSEITYLRQRQNLYKNGSKEWMDLEMQIQDKEEQEKFDREQQYIQRLAKYREETGRLNYQQLQEIELNGVKAMYGALLSAGKMTKEEYDAIIEHIKRKYAELEADQAADNNVRSRASKALDTATKKAGVEDVDAGNDAATGIFSIKSALENQKSINEQLKILYGKDYENNKEYQEAKRQLNLQTMQSIVAGAQAAYQSISTMMSAASSLAQANSDLEVARITANYDKQIEAAGKNSKKRERLEKERDEKIAKAKTKANKKAMAMEVAQAIAQTAMGAINAYTTTLAGAPWPANLVLAPISAGIALAAGAVQIATIKKQHQAEALGYYEGGFTGGRRYRREAGVVHEGEFVANHQAVGNPAVLPFLNFLDQAQRNNTVGSLTMQDVSRAAGGGAPTVVAPVVNVQTDNSELSGTLAEARDVLGRLTAQLEQGIGVDIPIDGENGMYRQLKRYENLLKNK